MDTSILSNFLSFLLRRGLAHFSQASRCRRCRESRSVMNLSRFPALFSLAAYDSSSSANAWAIFSGVKSRSPLLSGTRTTSNGLALSSLERCCAVVALMGLKDSRVSPVLALFVLTSPGLTPFRGMTFATAVL